MTSLAVSGTTPQIGATVQFSATATLSNGSSQTVTIQATWSSSNLSVATVNNAGVVSAVGVGESDVIATYLSVSGRLHITILPASAPPSAQTFTLTGLITDEDTGRGIVGARVEFLNGLNAGMAASSDATGSYLMSGLLAGTGRMRASANDYAWGEQNVTIPTNPRADFGLHKSCGYTLPVSSATVPGGYGGGDFTVTRTTSTGCPLTLSTSDSTWLNVFGPSPSFPNSVVYSVSGNPTTAPRTGTIAVGWPGGGATLTVTQLGAMCAASFSLSVPAAGGDGVSYLGEGCYWATGFAVDVGWIHVTGTHGGGLYLEYRMEMNTGSSRTGHIRMSGHGLDMQITINQSGAIP